MGCRTVVNTAPAGASTVTQPAPVGAWCDNYARTLAASPQPPSTGHVPEATATPIPFNDPAGT